MTLGADAHTRNRSNVNVTLAWIVGSQPLVRSPFHSQLRTYRCIAL